MESQAAQSLSFEALGALAHAAGLQVLGVTDATQLSSDLGHLISWQEAGYAANMEYMRRDPQLLTSPEQLLPGARSVMVVAVAYDRSPRPPLKSGFGRVARYAWGRDYHKVLRRRLETLCRLVSQQLGGKLSYRIFSDSVPLLERALAKRSEIGFIGKNTMAIIPGRGSFFLLGEVLWDLEVYGIPAVSHSQNGCGACSQCIDACPTQAFVGERILDARRCISYLTIEKRGSLSLEERRWVGEWVFGCDVCQEVCPFNFVTLKRRERAALEEFNAEAGVGPALDLADILKIRTQEEFLHRFAGTALMRAKREGLLRNAAIVAANTCAVQLFDQLLEAHENDPSEVVRQHTLWALSVLAYQGGEALCHQVKQLLQRAKRDPSSLVQHELGDIQRSF